MYGPLLFYKECQDTSIQVLKSVLSSLKKQRSLLQKMLYASTKEKN